MRKVEIRLCLELRLTPHGGGGPVLLGGVRRFMEWPAPHHAVLGINLGKNICSVAGLDVAGAVVLRLPADTGELVKFVAGLPECVVTIEACCGAALA